MGFLRWLLGATDLGPDETAVADRYLSQLRVELDLVGIRNVHLLAQEAASAGRRAVPTLMLVVRDGRTSLGRLTAMVALVLMSQKVPTARVALERIAALPPGPQIGGYPPPTLRDARSIAESGDGPRVHHRIFEYGPYPGYLSSLYGWARVDALRQARGAMTKEASGDAGHRGHSSR